MNKRFLIILLGLFLTACSSDEAIVISEQGKFEEIIPETQISTEIYVYICGEVMNPGVYSVPAGSRVVDVLTLSGGLTEDAAESFVNQAKILKDGEKVFFPSKEEAAGNGAAFGGKVNINTASKEELMTLPGIGESKALDIISFREKEGYFLEVSDIMKIPGIKNSVFEKIQDSITVD